MTDEVYEIRCDDCGGIFVDGDICNLIGWIRPTPIQTSEEQLKFDYDAGNMCKPCYNYRLSQLHQKSTRL
jgi:hypothetical protein